MQIVIGSAFRDAAGYAGRYFVQAAALRDELHRWGHALRLALVEGNSTDGTPDVLASEIARYGLAATVVDRTHAGEDGYAGDAPHGVSPVRMRNLAHVGNGILGQMCESDDLLLYVESDLIWNVPAALALLGHVAAGRCDIAVPLVFMGARFYDTWAYRIAGRAFDARWPYHPALRGWQPGQLVALDAAGSCLALNRAALRDAQAAGMPAWDVWPGLCKRLRERGHRLALDPAVRVEHPLVTR